MLILYNLLQIVFLIFFWPLLCIVVAITPKYRRQIPKRLGLFLKQSLQPWDGDSETIWIHALSVGEVTSALPLVAALKREKAESTIVFSAATQTGFDLACRLLSPHCDRIIPFPLDIAAVCSRYIDIVSPDLFILVETDFWPNFLHQLQRRSIPAMLVNGRISSRSMTGYQRHAFFFRPMFQSFRVICVQTETDRQRFISFGIEEGRVLSLGNLKYEPANPANMDIAAPLLAANRLPLVIAGSTHAGEEALLLEAFVLLRGMHPCRMIIAPRNPQRGHQIASLAHSYGLAAQLRSSDVPLSGDVYVVDSIGELVSFYAHSDICIVGGSFVNAGGHNPLEPAAQAKPVLFGRHMDDFEEISQDLVASGGAFRIHDQQELVALLVRLLEDEEFRRSSGEAARHCVLRNRDVIARHMQLIRTVR